MLNILLLSTFHLQISHLTMTGSHSFYFHPRSPLTALLQAGFECEISVNIAFPSLPLPPPPSPSLVNNHRLLSL